MASINGVRWDSLIIELVNLKVKNRTPDEEFMSLFRSSAKINILNEFGKRRSPEEFNEYIRELFDNRYPSFDYHWYLSSRRQKKRSLLSVYR